MGRGGAGGEAILHTISTYFGLLFLNIGVDKQVYATRNPKPPFVAEPFEPNASHQCHEPNASYQCHEQKGTLNRHLLQNPLAKHFLVQPFKMKNPFFAGANRAVFFLKGSAKMGSAKKGWLSFMMDSAKKGRFLFERALPTKTLPKKALQKRDMHINTKTHIHTHTLESTLEKMHTHTHTHTHTPTFTHPCKLNFKLIHKHPHTQIHTYTLESIPRK